MTKEEYLDKRHKLKDEIEELDKQYVNEYCRFKVGDKVELRGQLGVIETINATGNGSFEGSWTKIKINGESYSCCTRFCFFDYDEMEKVE